MGTWDGLSAMLGQLLDSQGLSAIFAVMLVKEIGVPVPIPSDLLMLAAAAQAAAGRYEVSAAYGLILLAMVAGATLQYALVRGIGRTFLFRFGMYVGLTPARLESVSESVRRGGPAAVALSLLTPGVRAATVPAAGLAEMPALSFLVGLVIGSAGFLALHFAVGFAAGSLLQTVVGAIGLPLLIMLVLFAVVGAAGWFVLRSRSSASSAEVARDWVDASCPICLCIGTAHQLRHREEQGPADLRL